MQTLIQSPPRSLMEVFKMLPEGTRAELINDTLYMSPAPYTNHQEISALLLTSLLNYIRKKKLGKAYSSPIDVYLNNKNAYQPDLIVILKENFSIIKENGIYGAPDLVVEILSPGTKNFDLVRKKRIYEKSGVKEYWIVDPATKECTGFQLSEEKYIEFKKEKGKLSSALLHHVFKF